jgi:hypothetical protein
VKASVGIKVIASAQTAVPSNVFIGEALRIVEEGRKRGIAIRVMGALACRIHSLECSELHKKLNRLGLDSREFTDIDFISYSRHAQDLTKLFESLGYRVNRAAFTFGWIWASRHIYDEPQGRFHVDVFFDKLKMCHTIDFRERLKLDYPTVPLAELLLEKIQIVRMAEKDVKDSIVLLKAHEVGEVDKETINAKRIAKILADDWGFWYTATSNLRTVKNLLRNYDIIAEEDKNAVAVKIDKIMEYIEMEPKSIGWKMRASVGARKKWYDDVEELPLSM